MEPEELFKRITWRGVISISPAMETFTTWTITGVAAVIVLLVGNLESIGKIIAFTGLKIAIAMMVGSLLLGVISKQYGLALSAAVEMTSKLEAMLNSEPGQDLINALAVDTAHLGRAIAEPFWWPLSSLMSRSFQAGANDPLRGDRGLVKMFCMQLYSNFAHVLLAICALAVLVSYIQ